jgi:HEAT repeat protein
LAREQDLDVLEAALDDADADVRLAAIRALGVFARLGIEQAADLIIAGLIETEGNVQRVAAETLAELGPTGEAVLREGAQDQDLVVRRAAVYGLAALDQPWSREMLAKMEREDDEWFVRNAALEALAHLETGSHTDTTIELSLPRAEAEPWLVAWAAERGVGTGVGEAALATLTRALAEDDLPIRQAAVDSLRRLADPRTIDLLRQTLRDPEPTVRDTALLALNEISRRYALPITLN